MILKFIDGMHYEAVYDVAAYTLKRPDDGVSDHPVCSFTSNGIAMNVPVNELLIVYSNEGFVLDKVKTGMITHVNVD
jgi:hypothetical protein